MKLSKPNIFILNNRWDASAAEPDMQEEVGGGTGRAPCIQDGRAPWIQHGRAPWIQCVGDNILC